eukprot:5232738-Prymnesium_polylepis.1
MEACSSSSDIEGTSGGIDGTPPSRDGVALASSLVRAAERVANARREGRSQARASSIATQCARRYYL